MPSLRRSLIVYFLLLLAVGLGTVAVLADQVIGRALVEKQKATAKLIDSAAKENEGKEHDRFDAELMSHAKAVARTAGIEYIARMDAANKRFAAHQDGPTLGLLAAGLVEPNGWLAAASWRALIHVPPPRRGPPGPPVPPGPAFDPLFKFNYADLKFEEYLVQHLDDDDKTGDFIQVHHSRGKDVWRSPNLGQFVMPFDRGAWEAEGESARTDDIELPGGAARRVTFKTTPNGVPGMMQWGPPRFGPPVGGSPGGSPPARDGGGQSNPPRFNTDPMYWFPRSYIHVVRLTAPRDEAVGEIRRTAEAEKVGLTAGTESTRGGVRLALAAIVGVAFLGMVVGGWLVIGVGLAPLRKLSDAVSRVSEKDFHLPVEREELTHELAPIHDRLTHSLEALKLAFDREKESVADISHELRTPVAGLLATIDVSLRKPRTADQYKQTLEDCRGITKQLSGLVERVMTLAYLDAGQTGVHTAPIDATDVAGECAAVIRPLAEAHGLTLTADVNEPAELTTDADKLREVVLNLLHNAVEYNQPGGNVRLSVRRAVAAGPVVVEVSDTGIGMTADVKGKIFERFYRADPSRTATGVHAGLGLAIVKEYVDRLGGSISVESEPGRGSTFRVTLPC